MDATLTVPTTREPRLEEEVTVVTPGEHLHAMGHVVSMGNGWAQVQLAGGEAISVRFKDLKYAGSEERGAGGTEAGSAQGPVATADVILAVPPPAMRNRSSGNDTAVEVSIPVYPPVVVADRWLIEPGSPPPAYGTGAPAGAGPQPLEMSRSQDGTPIYYVPASRSEARPPD